jgi:gliding motility-associated-like protein
MYVSKGTCLDTVSKVITVEMPSKLDVPNVFTPNGDGSNDVFFLKVANLTDISANIFDRWGNKVYESTSSTGNIAWDGTGMSGKELPAGTYFYVIKATGKDGMAYEKKGNVSIYR